VQQRPEHLDRAGAQPLPAHEQLRHPGRRLHGLSRVDCAPIHLDAHYSSKTEWGRPLVCSLVALSIVGGMTVRSTSGLTIANLGWCDIVLEAPVFVGDTLHAETEITEKRLSRSRSDNGIVTCRTTGLKASGERVLHYTRSFLVPTDAAAVRDETGY